MKIKYVVSIAVACASLAYADAVFAHGDAPEIVAVADATRPFLSKSPLDCVVQPNPAYWNRRDIKVAVAASSAALKASAEKMQNNTPTGALKAAIASSGPGKEAIRVDTSGNVIIRVAFLFSDNAVAKIGSYAKLVAEAKRILVDTQADYQLSGAKLAFEYAGEQMLTGSPEGDLAKFPISSHSVLATMRTPAIDMTLAGQAGQLEATQRFKQAVRANVMVGVASNGQGVAIASSRRYDIVLDGTMAIAVGPSDSNFTPALFAGDFGHEFGHSIGQTHGLVTDRVTDPVRILRYRVGPNFPYAMGYEAFAPGSAANGVFTAMTYNALNIPYGPWFSATATRLSNPNQSLVINPDFPLARISNGRH